MCRASRSCRGSICGSIPTTGLRCSAPTATARRPWPGCWPAASRRWPGDVTRSPEARLRLFCPASDRGDAARRASAFDHLVGADARRAARGGARPARQVRLRPGQGLCAGRRISRAASGRGSTSRSSPTTRPSLLILDEPTNHLDIETREALVEAINDFPGAVVLVSHDWHLVELVADRLWLVADGTVRPFEGDLEDYRAPDTRGRRSRGGRARRRTGAQ